MSPIYLPTYLPTPIQFAAPFGVEAASHRFLACVFSPSHPVVDCIFPGSHSIIHSILALEHGADGDNILSLPILSLFSAFIISSTVTTSLRNLT